MAVVPTETAMLLLLATQLLSTLGPTGRRFGLISSQIFALTQLSCQGVLFFFSRVPFRRCSAGRSAAPRRAVARRRSRSKYSGQTMNGKRITRLLGVRWRSLLFRPRFSIPSLFKWTRRRDYVSKRSGRCIFVQ